MVEAARVRLWRQLPLTILAVMLALALGIEALRFGAVLWLPKLPLAALLLWAFLRSRRPES